MPPDRTLMLILAYCGILSVIPLFAERDDREIQWHAKNGLGIFIAAILGAVVLTIVGSIVFGDDGCLSGCAFHCIYSLAFIALSIAAMAKALMRGRLRIPFISDLADRF